MESISSAWRVRFLDEKVWNCGINLWRRFFLTARRRRDRPLLIPAPETANLGKAKQAASPPSASR
jgi:hypothetical protein